MRMRTRLFNTSLKDKLTYVALPDNWLVWHNGNDSMRFIRPNLLDNTISVDVYLEVNSFLSVSAWFHGQAISTSLNSINDIRQVESMLHEISSKSVTDYSNNSHSHHLPRAKKHIEMAVNELTRTDGGENNSSYLAKLQFILCQLDNTLFIQRTDGGTLSVHKLCPLRPILFLQHAMHIFRV